MHRGYACMNAVRSRYRAVHIEAFHRAGHLPKGKEYLDGFCMAVFYPKFAYPVRVHLV
ncbi:MAG: hypothetical protein AAFU83_03695 [Bacteroidota bacterium]